MGENTNISTQIKGVNCLESINQGLLALAEQAMRQGEYVLASKLRAGIKMNQARIDQLRNDGARR